MTINEALEQIGLTKRESLVYLHLLKYGPSSPTEIGSKTNIKRPNVYDVFKSLEKNGLIKYQLINKKRLIAPESPEKIPDILEQKMKLAKSLVPTLKNLDSEASFQGKITFYQGKKAMQNLMWESINMKKKEFWGLWAASDMDKVLGHKLVERFITKRIKKGIRLKTLHPIEKESFYDEEVKTQRGRELTEIRYTPDNHTFALSMQIYDDTVSFYSSKKESYGFKVESKEFSELMKMLYKHIWDHSGKLNQN